MFITNINLNKSPSFKAGKTLVFTDFDRTYTPFSHREMCDYDTLQPNSERRNCFNKYFQGIKNLSDTAKDKFSLTVTTGRNLAEYKFVENALKDKNLDYFSPHFLITRDGGDRFVREDNKWIKDESKSQKIRQESSGWNAEKIKSAIKSIVKKEDSNPFFMESDVNRCEWDYRGISLEHNLASSDAPNVDRYVSFIKDEDNTIEAAFSNKLPVENIKNQIEKFLKDNNINAVVNHYPKDTCGYCPQFENNTMTYEPGNKIIIKPRINNERITKLYDVKEAVKNVVENDTNDLVIAAGDEFNDEEMLNPLNYLDIYNVKVDKKEPLCEILERREVLDAIGKLPLNVIIVGNSPSLNHLREMGEILQSKGIDKIICIENSADEKNGMLKAIKKAMFKYTEQNDEYSFNIGMDLYMSLIDGGSVWQ